LSFWRDPQYALSYPIRAVSFGMPAMRLVHGLNRPKGTYSYLASFPSPRYRFGQHTINLLPY
jgi:hypothetical protein